MYVQIYVNILKPNFSNNPKTAHFFPYPSKFCYINGPDLLLSACVHTTSTAALDFFSLLGIKGSYVEVEEGLKPWPVREQFTVTEPSLCYSSTKYWGEGTGEKKGKSSRIKWKRKRQSKKIKKGLAEFVKKKRRVKEEAKRKQRSLLVKHLPEQ